jgi:hypothetical protein
MSRKERSGSNTLIKYTATEAADVTNFFRIVCYTPTNHILYVTGTDTRHIRYRVSKKLNHWTNFFLVRK